MNYESLPVFFYDIRRCGACIETVNNCIKIKSTTAREIWRESKRYLCIIDSERLLITDIKKTIQICSDDNKNKF